MTRSCLYSPGVAFAVHYRNFWMGSSRAYILRAPLIQPSGLIPKPHFKWTLGKRKNKTKLLPIIQSASKPSVCHWEHVCFLEGGRCIWLVTPVPVIVSSSLPSSLRGWADTRRLFVAYAPKMIITIGNTYGAPSVCELWGSAPRLCFGKVKVGLEICIFNTPAGDSDVTSP